MSRSRVRCGNRGCVAALGRVKKGGTALRVAEGVAVVERGEGVVELRCPVCGWVRRFRVRDTGEGPQPGLRPPLSQS